MENPNQPNQNTPRKVDRTKIQEGDLVLVCKDCGSEFIFTKGEQDFYASRTPPLNPPKRDGMCRMKKRQRYAVNYKLDNKHDRPNTTREKSPVNTQPIASKDLGL